MNYNYVKSKDIQLFPSAFRGQYETTGTVFNPGSRLTTEYNLTTLSSRTSKYHQSYVLQYDSETIVFSLKGYLFSIKMNSYLALFTSQVWARIRLVDIDSGDTNNTKETKPVLRPVDTEASTIYLDEVSADGKFLGIDLSEEEPDAVLGQYVLLILEKVGGAWSVPSKSYFRLRADEISDKTSSTKSIDKEFNTENLIATKINNVTIATTGTGASGKLTITDGKELKVQDDVTLAGTGTITLNKNLTINNNNFILDADAERTLKISGANKEIAGLGTKLTLGSDLATTGTGKTTFAQSSSDITLTLPTTSQTLATIAGTEVLTNKTLTTPKITGGSYKYNIVGSSLSADRDITLPLLLGNDVLVFADFLQTLKNKTFVTPILGAATATSINGLIINTTTGTLGITNEKTLTVSDSTTLATNVITLGSGKTLTAQYASLEIGASGKTGNITVQSSDTTARTLTLIGNPIIGALELQNASTGFTIKGGSSTEKTLTVSETYTLGPACAKNILDVTNSTARTIVNSGTDLVTERTIYYGLPTINNSHTYNSGTNIYAPASGGASGQILVAQGATTAPSWANPSTITAGTASVLETTRTLWGQNFTGGADVSGNLTDVGSISRRSASGTYNIGTSGTPFTNIYATTFYATSDERLKKNIKEYNYNNSILDIQVKEFDYIDSGVHTIGFIAQELQKKFPELVHVGEDGYLSIAENKLVYLLLEEVKLLKEEVRLLKEVK